MIFETLDFHTVVFMASILAFALSFLLVGVKIISENLDGIGNWAAAIALIGSALFTFLDSNLNLHWRTVIGSLFMTLGFGLYYLGILAFDRIHVKKRLIVTIYIIFVSINMLIAIYLDGEYVLILLNTLVCITLSLLSSMVLLTKHKQQKNEVGYKITSYMFLLFVMLSIYRVSSIFDQKYRTIDKLIGWDANVISFIGCIFCIALITFSLILTVYERLANQLSFAAGHDWLTGVMNRGNLEREAARLQARSLRENHNFSILLMDIDFFKKVNDQYGHMVGDEVLKKFTKLTERCLRVSDIIGRYGGEEFCVLLPKVNEIDALAMAERIRVTLEEEVIILKDNQIQCTVSIGVADAKVGNGVFEKMLASADTALYEAKKNGRNQTVCFSSLKLNSSLILTAPMID